MNRSQGVSHQTVRRSQALSRVEGPKSPQLEVLDPRTQVTGGDTTGPDMAAAAILQAGRPSRDSGRQRKDDLHLGKHDGTRDVDGRCSVWNDGRKEEKKRIPREETYVRPPPPNIYYYGWSDGRQERRGEGLRPSDCGTLVPTG